MGCLKFSSVPELVAYYRAHSMAEVDPVIDLMLSTPIEKYTVSVCVCVRACVRVCVYVHLWCRWVHVYTVSMYI